MEKKASFGEHKTVEKGSQWARLSEMCYGGSPWDNLEATSRAQCTGWSFVRMLLLLYYCVDWVASWISIHCSCALWWSTHGPTLWRGSLKGITPLIQCLWRCTDGHQLHIFILSWATNDPDPFRQNGAPSIAYIFSSLFFQINNVICVNVCVKAMSIKCNYIHQMHHQIWHYNTFTLPGNDLEWFFTLLCITF